ncbi:MAG: hypothetical protein Q8R76_11555 [Candidatus Omnitrophota bacterium]|nr:hypothetical protein [Candidatus Omnitrophota bacterium]
MLSIEYFKNLDLRIATVETVDPHPNADRLYVLGVRIGETRKTIVAGIRPFYDIEEVKGKTVVVVNNLEPAVIRGVESQGMLLAASAGDNLSLVVPERPMPDGTVVR